MKPKVIINKVITTWSKGYLRQRCLVIGPLRDDGKTWYIINDGPFISSDDYDREIEKLKQIDNLKQ